MAKIQLDTIPRVSRIRGFIDSYRMINNPILILNKYSINYGDTYTFCFGGIKKVIVSSNPVFMQHILKTNYENYPKSDIQMNQMGHFMGTGLLNSNGKYWLTQRRLIQHGFHKDRLALLVESMKSNLDESLRIFERDVMTHPFDLHRQLIKITFRMVTSSLFDISLKEEELMTLSNSVCTIEKFIAKQIVQPYLIPWLKISGKLKRCEEMRVRTDNYILQHIKNRRLRKDYSNDMLQILLDAKYEDTGEGMSDAQVLSESMQLLVAGHETSSTALFWTIYLLCKNPEWIEKIRREIKSQLGPSIQLSDLQKLEYTTQVLEEAMRLYPPFWMLDRMALESDCVSGIDIPEGTTVIAFLYGAHHSSRFWDNPELFNPSRFSKDNKKKHTPFAYLPFGGGPRVCIGSSYAMIQMLLILSAMIVKYDFEISADKEIAMYPRLLLRPNDVIKIRIKKVAGYTPN